MDMLVLAQQQKAIQKSVIDRRWRFVTQEGRILTEKPKNRDVFWTNGRCWGTWKKGDKAGAVTGRVPG